MAQFNMLPFQQTAVEELTAKFKVIWDKNYDNLHEIVFKSPTGSGKTFMVSNFINGLHTQPDWNEDVAFVWITFSDDLAMQSRDKFFEYFHPNIGNQLLLPSLKKPLKQRKKYKRLFKKRKITTNARQKLRPRESNWNK